MTDQTLQMSLRLLPSVEEVLQVLNTSPYETAKALPHTVKVEVIRKEIDHFRKAILQSAHQESTQHSTYEEDHNKQETINHNESLDSASRSKDILDEIVQSTVAQLTLQARPSLRRVVNATGIIIHTNLGRSVLADKAIESVVEVAKGYSTLEYNTKTMKRGSRHDHYEELICALTGSEAALAVNNNAAAVMMVLHEFARGKQAVISRGELIEIGGSFRIPDIMDFSQAEMIEVGTTNKTHLSDYERAITPNTALLLKVHTSNYRLVGFTESVKAKDLKKLADAINQQRLQDATATTSSYAASQASSLTTPDSPLSPCQPLMVYEDLGSGMFIRPHWLPQTEEPTVKEALREGCDLISFSGDKLLGGPQAGIIVGRKDLIARLKKNPLARALRLDKMSIAALEATLRLYLDPQQAMTTIPTLAMLCAPAQDIKAKAEHLKYLLEQNVASEIATFTVTEEVARAGGGSLPMFDIPSYAVEVAFNTSCYPSANAQNCIEFLIQNHEQTVIGRINHHKLLFDVRTLVQEEDLHDIVKGMSSFASSLHQGSHHE